MWYKTKPTFILNETGISQRMQCFSTHHEHSLNCEVKWESTWVIPESRLSLDRHRRKMYWAKACCSWVRKVPTNKGTASKFYAPEVWHQASCYPRDLAVEICAPLLLIMKFFFLSTTVRFISDTDTGHQQLVLHVHSVYNAQKIS